jgi:hypothetical protein
MTVQLNHPGLWQHTMEYYRTCRQYTVLPNKIYKALRTIQSESHEVQKTILYNMQSATRVCRKSMEGNSSAVKIRDMISHFSTVWEQLWEEVLLSRTTKITKGLVRDINHYPRFIFPAGIANNDGMKASFTTFLKYAFDNFEDDDFVCNAHDVMEQIHNICDVTTEQMKELELIMSFNRGRCLMQCGEDDGKRYVIHKGKKTYLS